MLAKIAKATKPVKLIPKSVVIWRQIALLALSLLTGMTLASCALSPTGDNLTGAQSAQAREAAVRAAVQRRWDAMIKGDYDTAYDMMSAASRSTVSRDTFKAITRHGFTGVRIESVSCDGDTCHVRVVATYDLKEIKGMPGMIDEVWLFENGRPSYVYRR